MLQPRATNCHYKKCINNHIFIFFLGISHLGTFNAIYTVIVGNFANMLSYYYIILDYIIGAFLFLIVYANYLIMFLFIHTKIVYKHVICNFVLSQII